MGGKGGKGNIDNSAALDCQALPHFKLAW